MSFIKNVFTNFKCWLLPSPAFLRGLSIGSLVTIFLFSFAQSPPPLPNSNPILQKDGFVVAYDSRFRIPLWTFEEIRHEGKNFSPVSRKTVNFKEDSLISPLLRSKLSDYHLSGYDRGHMVSAANQRLRNKAVDETFELSNVCPQNPEFNRGYWAQFERAIRSWAKEYEKVEIITGPLFLPKLEGERKFIRFEVIGENNVAVPTHFFKLIKFCTGQEKQVKAYIMPNEEIGLDISFEAFEVPHKCIVKNAGL